MSESLERARKLVREASGAIRNSVSCMTAGFEHRPELSSSQAQQDLSAQAQG